MMSAETDPLINLCPEIPWPKQQAFLDLDCTEAFYGGAAAGGKSSCLLMDALQYVHLPRFSALILRKDYQRLSLSGGLIPRSHDWLHGKAHWNGTSKTWTFPSGARIQFGYLDNSKDKFRYGSSEYQYIAFDELTEFPQDDYTFLFSRLRRTEDNPAPLKMRSASNPGGIGHLWVLERFVSQDARDALRDGDSSGVYYKDSPTGETAFVPAKIADNPAINEKEYRKNLSHLDPVTRERLMNAKYLINVECNYTAQMAGLHEVPAMVRDVPDRAAIAMALIENIQRENLNPLEEAGALQRLIDEFEMTHQQAAEAVGRSRTAVTNLLRLLELNDDVKHLLEKSELEMGHARALLGLGGKMQSDAARVVARRGMSVRETERLVRRRLRQQTLARSGRPAVDPDIQRLQLDLSERLGAKVHLQHSARGKGKLVISYNSLDELDGILKHIK